MFLEVYFFLGAAFFGDLDFFGDFLALGFLGALVRLTFDGDLGLLADLVFFAAVFGLLAFFGEAAFFLGDFFGLWLLNFLLCCRRNAQTERTRSTFSLCLNQFSGCDGTSQILLDERRKLLRVHFVGGSNVLFDSLK